MTPAAYYNEIDPFAAQWLRNLIAGGHIAPGEVDERSIEDVTPDDLRGFVPLFRRDWWMVMLCAWPDGRITDRSGQEVARASLSARQAKAMGLLTTAFVAPFWLISSADLSASLASKLQEVASMVRPCTKDLEGMGYASGLRRLRQRVSVAAHESGPTGWPTPTCNTNPQPETKRGLQNLSER
jgi:hypothetical protein